MGTITIESNKTDDLYFLNEMAKRMNLKSNIETPENEIRRELNDLKAEDKKLAEMISYSGRQTIGKILENEPGDIF